MGTDINLYIEEYNKKTKKWDITKDENGDIEWLNETVGRDYTLYEIMGKDGAFTSLEDTILIKGFPRDVNPELKKMEKEDYTAYHNAITFDELFKYRDDVLIKTYDKKEGYIDYKTFMDWDEYTEVNPKDWYYDESEIDNKDKFVIEEEEMLKRIYCDGWYDYHGKKLNKDNIYVHAKWGTSYYQETKYFWDNLDKFAQGKDLKNLRLVYYFDF